MRFEEFPIPFMFSSKVTAEELDQSFLDTRVVSIFQMAEGWSDEDMYCTPAEAYRWRPFDELPDGNKYVSFLSRPRVPLDNNNQLCEMVFYEPKWIDGFKKYVAILSRTINSAPGNDTHWPYGRYYLHEIDGNVGGKFFGDGLRHDFNFSQDNPDSDTSEILWQEMFEFHELNDRIKSFGLLLCNFKDQLDDESFGTWDGLLKTITELEESDNPAVDKVAIRQTAFQIVSNYITLRKNLYHEQLALDIRKFKDRLNFDEIQNIKNSDFSLNLSSGYEWRRVCNAMANIGIPELRLPESITTTIVEDMFFTPHFGKQGCFDPTAGYSLEMGVSFRNPTEDPSLLDVIDLTAYLNGQPDEDFFCYSDRGNQAGVCGGFVVRTTGLLISHQTFLNNESKTFEFFNQYMAPYLFDAPESLFDHVIVLYSEYRRDFWILSTDPRSWDPNKPDDHFRLRVPERYGIVGRWAALDENQTYNPRHLSHFDSPSFTPRLRAAAKYLESCLSVDTF